MNKYYTLDPSRSKVLKLPMVEGVGEGRKIARCIFIHMPYLDRVC